MTTIPTEIRTPRLLLRAPRPGDGAIVNAAIKESFERLTVWMPWAKTMPTLEQSEENLLDACEKWKSKEELRILVFNPDGTTLIGSSGLHEINWSIPKLEIGAWVKTGHEGKGLMSETLNAVTRFAFQELHAKRIDAVCDPKNLRSKNMIERLGFQFESKVMRRDDEMLMYYRTNIDGLPPLDVTW